MINVTSLVSPYRSSSFVEFSSDDVLPVCRGRCPGLRNVIVPLLAPREGRLVAPPVETTRYQFAAACARHCLSLPDTVCRSFNYNYDYDSATAGVCELMNRVEERTIHVRQVSRR